jgi:predicted heme/steroid binding protein
MRCKIYDFYLINNLEYSDRTFDKQKQYEQNVLPSKTEPAFSKNDLAKYNGKDGMPAYVAVNGNVYDITNVAAWGAATHFGLSAGNDLTAQFASCHAAQPILQKLPIVGKMIE